MSGGKWDLWVQRGRSRLPHHLLQWCQWAAGSGSPASEWRQIEMESHKVEPEPSPEMEAKPPVFWEGSWLLAP